MTEPLPSHAPPLPPAAVSLLRKLSEQRVEFVLVGPLAAAVHGCPPTAERLEVVPARFSRNIDRLARAVRGVGAKWHDRSDASAQPVDLTAQRLSTLGRWPLSTDLGELEVDFEPPGTAGHLDLFEGAHRFALARGLGVDVAAAADLLRIAEMRSAPGDETVAVALRGVLAHRAGRIRLAATESPTV